MRISVRPVHPYQRGNTLAGVLVGLLIGVVIAAAVAIYINFGDPPVRVAPPAVPARTAPSGSEPVALPGKPGERPADNKPSLDFYKVLPGGDAASAPVPTPPKAEAPADRFFVQAGAFQNPSEADNLKARLALMDIEAGVVRAEVPDRGTVHRVRIGPFASFGAAESLRARLAQDGIETAIVRSKPQADGGAVAKKP